MRTHVNAVVSCLLLAACESGADQGFTSKQEMMEASEEGTPTAVLEDKRSASAAATLVPVTDPSTVCMVNDRYMGSPQIPVELDGKTYFGCCKMCEKRLRTEPGVRTATDPVSHNRVDKSVAIPARDKAGNVFYFESEQSLSQFGVQP